MKIDQINANQICSVRSFVNTKCKFYKYKSEIKILGIVFRREGYYYTMTLHGDEYITEEEIISDGTLFCEGEVVYYKPHLEIRMSNQENRTFFFPNQYGLEMFMDTDRMRAINWINRPTLIR